MGQNNAVVKINKGIVLDSYNTEWDNIPAMKTDRLRRVAIGRPNSMFPGSTPCWNGPQDLSYETKMKWRDNALYLLIKVTDNNLKLSPQKNDPNVYNFDCVELFLDIRSHKNAFVSAKTSGAEQILIVPSESNTMSPCRVIYTSQEPVLFANFAGKKTKFGYMLQGKILPNKNTSFKFIAGASFGFDIAVDDADAGVNDGHRKTQMTIFGDKNNYSNTIKWGRFHLK